MKLYLILFSLLTFGICSYPIAATAEQETEDKKEFSWSYNRLNLVENRKLLDHTFGDVRSKFKNGTVGVIPFYWIEGKFCILLSRERADRDTSKAGTYSDLGGKTLAGASVKAEMAREYKEETLGGRMEDLDTSPERLSNAFLLTGRDEIKGREIFYLLYPLSEEEYTLSLKLNILRDTLRDGDLGSECLEKDRFFWFSMEDVCKKATDPSFILTPIGASLPAGDRPVALRSFFTRDFVINPLLQTILKECAEIQDQKNSHDKKAA
jgi:hypothetical protein